MSILTDALRGTRETPKQTCASLLAALVAEHGPDRVEIRMFHTPNLVGLKKKHIPQRINEGWGLQHMKLYGIDDEIMLSGCELLYFRRPYPKLVLTLANASVVAQSKSFQRLLHRPPRSVPCFQLGTVDRVLRAHSPFSMQH